MAATIKEIAKFANVSIATVSRALANDEKVKPETRKLIMEVAGKLNYNPNLLARNFVKKQSNIIGMVLPDISDEFFSELIRGVDETSFRNNYFTMITSSHENRSLETAVSTLMGGGLVGGIILLIPQLSPKLKEILHFNRVPYVIISGDNDIGNYDVVSIDNYQAAYNMTSFLILERGYTKLAHITGPADNYDAIIRKNGFIDACRDNGIEVRPEWITEGKFTLKSGEDACEKLLSLSERPRAVLAANDMMALGCYNVCLNHGFSIPDDLGIAGFDDIFLARHLSPSLTTVQVNIEEVGKIATRLLISRMQGDNSEPQKIKVTAQIKIRNSC